MLILYSIVETLSTEKELIFHCIRSQSLKELPPDIDWSLLKQILEKENLIPLFHHWLMQIPNVPDKVPTAFLEELKQNYYRTAARNAIMIQEKKCILKHFQEEGIPVILYKDLFQKERLYGNAALRPVNDIDLIVRTEDLSRVATCLKSNGFREGLASHSWDKNPLHLDIHTDIINTKRFLLAQRGESGRIQKMWERSKRIEMEGVSTRVLSIEDQLIALSVHLAFSHRLKGYLRFLDMIRFLEYYKGEIDWEQMLQLAAEYQNGKSVYYSLRYLKEKFGASVPYGILTVLKPKRESRLVKKILRTIWEGKEPGKLGYFFRLSLLENKKLRRRYLWLTFLGFFR